MSIFAQTEFTWIRGMLIYTERYLRNLTSKNKKFPLLQRFRKVQKSSNFQFQFDTRKQNTMQIIFFLRRSLANSFTNVILRLERIRVYSYLCRSEKKAQKKTRQEGKEKKSGKTVWQTSQGVIAAPPRTNYGEDRRGQQASGGQARRAQRFQPEDRCQQSPPQGTVHQCSHSQLSYFEPDPLKHDASFFTDTQTELFYCNFFIEYFGMA